MNKTDNYTEAFRQLSQDVQDAGLTRRRYWFSWSMITGILLALTVLVVVIMWVGRTWFQLLAAAVLGVIMTQLALLSHEAAHQQLFASRAWNE